MIDAPANSGREVVDGRGPHLAALITYLQRPLSAGGSHDGDGVLRLVTTPWTATDLLTVAVEEPIQFASGAARGAAPADDAAARGGVAGTGGQSRRRHPMRPLPGRHPIAKDHTHR